MTSARLLSRTVSADASSPRFFLTSSSLGSCAVPPVNDLRRCPLHLARCQRGFPCNLTLLFRQLKKLMIAADQFLITQ
jgi:hypothetical protein